MWFDVGKKKALRNFHPKTWRPTCPAHVVFGHSPTPGRAGLFVPES